MAWAGTVPGCRKYLVLNRPTIELVVLALTVTVCALILAAGAALIIALIVNPAELILEPYVNAFGSAITVIVGALLGLIAGRRGRSRDHE